MAVNKATLDLITEFEGVELEAYADPAHGWKVPTIGIGHTSVAGPPVVKQGMRITREEAFEILKRDLRKYEGYVREFITVPLNENQHGALTSWTFNLGPGNLEKSTLRKKLNNGDYKGAADEILKWDNAGGKKMKGLTRRREAERALFLKPVSKVTLEPAPHLGPKDYVDAEPIQPKPVATSNWIWVISAVLAFAAIIFIVTQVRF